jgi:hypothetical protein
MAKTIKYHKVNKLSDEDFKRVTGVSRETFKMMVNVVKKHYKEKKFKGGRTTNLVPSDEILLMLEYYREYRTFKHISIDYEVSESTAHYVVTKMEKILIKDQRFHLTSLKHSKPSKTQNLDVIVVDVTESPCERPKKSNENTIQVRKNDTD